VLLLVSGATATMRREQSRRLGFLFVPSQRALPPDTNGRPWAADNGAFAGFDEPAFVEMLAGLAGREGGLFVSAPDVVGDAAATLARFEEWEPRIRAFGLPVALVAQDGLTPGEVPWPRIAALSVGGTTAWKLGPDAAALVAEAKRRGKWAHIGRVNTRRRFKVRRADRL
jgi:hypothetical protein